MEWWNQHKQKFKILEQDKSFWFWISKVLPLGSHTATILTPPPPSNTCTKFLPMSTHPTEVPIQLIIRNSTFVCSWIIATYLSSDPPPLPNTITLSVVTTPDHPLPKICHQHPTTLPPLLWSITNIYPCNSLQRIFIHAWVDWFRDVQVKIYLHRWYLTHLNKNYKLYHAIVDKVIKVEVLQKQHVEVGV